MDKRIIVTFTVLIIVVSMYGQLNKFTITGKIDGVLDGTPMFLVRNSEDSKADTVQRTKVYNKKFKFYGTLSMQGEFYFIKLDTLKKEYIKLLMESKNIFVKSSSKSWPEAKVRGSKSHSEYYDFYRNVEKPYSDRSDIYSKYLSHLINNKVSQDSIKLLSDKKTAELELVKYGGLFTKGLDNWITTHPNSMLTPLLISNNYSADSGRLVNAFDRLTPVARSGKYGIVLQNYITALSNTAIGAKAPEFSLLSIAGDTMSIKEIVSGSKLTLIDFWAYWCSPCREEFPKLKNIFNKYKDKGLNIVGLSVDPNEKQWKKAVQEDGLPWLNLCDSRQKSAMNGYGITAIPQLFLIGQDGIIIAKSNEGLDVLENTIKKYLD